MRAGGSAAGGSDAAPCGDTSLYIGVDVGTSSARAGVFDEHGNQLGFAEHPITVHHCGKDRYEQSSAEICHAISTCIRSIFEDDGQHTTARQRPLDPSLVAGIGFDATCSLVVVPNRDLPDSQIAQSMKSWFAVDTAAYGSTDIIMWMDHRAAKEAIIINATKHPALRYVGGSVNMEMQLPKILWMHGHGDLKTVYRLFDLSDWLVWWATGGKSGDMRSVCTVGCKWTYVANDIAGDVDAKKGWQRDLFAALGLEGILAQNDFEKIGKDVVNIGSCVGSLSQLRMSEWGLGGAARVAVAAGIIDAHAGVLGVLGMGGASFSPSGAAGQSKSCVLSMICGTSACHMVLNEKEHFVPGVWGPYKDAVLPGYFLTEGGQSAAGLVLDMALKDLKYATSTAEPAGLATKHRDVTKFIMHSETREADILGTLADRHVLPFILGSRMHSEGNLCFQSVGVFPSTGAVNGKADEHQPLSAFDKLDPSRLLTIAADYLLAIHSVAYEAREILERMRDNGLHEISRIHMCGGLSKNPLYVQAHADVTGLDVWIVGADDKTETVVLGGAIMGAVASRSINSHNASELGEALHEVGTQMAPNNVTVVRPRRHLAKWHDGKFNVFKAMREDQSKYRRMMNDSQ